MLYTHKGCYCNNHTVPIVVLYLISDGFRKVAKPDHGGLTSITDDSVEFWHTNFRKGHPELLSLVQRRVSVPSTIHCMIAI